MRPSPSDLFVSLPFAAFGTHNSLLSLENGIYFEVLSLDPSLPKPSAGYMFGLTAEAIALPHVLTWFLSTGTPPDSLIPPPL